MFIDKLNYIIKKLTSQRDKLEHFYWGFWITVLCLPFYFITKSLYYILLPPFILGLSKELWDKYNNGTVEFADFLFTIIPSVIITLVILMF